MSPFKVGIVLCFLHLISLVNVAQKRIDPNCLPRIPLGSFDITCTGSDTCSDNEICCRRGSDDCGAGCVDACFWSPGYCHNNGSCLYKDGLSCECTDGYTGDRCETRKCILLLLFFDFNSENIAIRFYTKFFTTYC